MRILYLCPSPHLGLRDRAGWSTHMDGVIVALRREGHDVYAYMADNRRPRSPSWVTSPLHRLAPAGLRLARRDLTELRHDRRLGHLLLDVCAEFEPDAIYERTEVYHTAGARVARRLGLPLVLELNGPLVEEREAWAGMALPGVARRMEATKYAAADAVVTVSTALAEHLAGNGVDRGKIHPIPNAADTALFDPQHAHPEAVRQQFGLGRRLVVGFVGAFADWHGLEALVTAMGAVARSRILDAHLLMVGEGPTRPALRDLAGWVGLEGRVTMPGSVPHDQVPHYLAAMDVCVLPRANWYMSPIKLFEYGAMGRAVIAPRTPAVAEVMTDGEDGLLVEPGCPEALARAIRFMATHPEERTAMAGAFQRRVRQHHTWKAVAGRVSLLLEQSLRAREIAAVPERPQAAPVDG